MPYGINHYIVITSVLFGLGLYTIITYKHLFKLLSGIVLIFLSAIMNFAAFSGFWGFNTEGQIIIYILSAVCFLHTGLGYILLKNNSNRASEANNE